MDEVEVESCQSARTRLLVAGNAAAPLRIRQPFTAVVLVSFSAGTPALDFRLEIEKP